MPDRGVEVFEEHRGLLYGVAYRMLGSVDEAEDIVQETWLRWDRADRSQVTDPKAYLIRIASRASLDHLRRAATRRESYVGPWLPEPLLTGPDIADDAAVADSVSIAMLVVLETLSPLERAVFVLKEAFGFNYREIGEALDRSEQAIRQLAHRARQHVQARRPRFQPDRQVRRAATERFLQAATGGNLAALLEVLAPDVTLVSDGGGKVRSPRRPIHGADNVARFFIRIADGIPAGTRLHFVDVNGEPGAVGVLGSTPYAVLVLDLDPQSHQVKTIHVIGNPDKLSRLTPTGSAVLLVDLRSKDA
jgi:RNA polymerase sigma-70 factor, ECF subfamily